MRPSRRASLANKSSVWNFASSSFQYGLLHPPRSISPTPPGSCMTPSAVTYSAATILLMSSSRSSRREFVALRWFGLERSDWNHRSRRELSEAPLPDQRPQRQAPGGRTKDRSAALDASSSKPLPRPAPTTVLSVPAEAPPASQWGVLGGEVAGELAKTMRARGSEASLARIVSAQAPDAVIIGSDNDRQHG